MAASNASRVFTGRRVSAVPVGLFVLSGSLWFAGMAHAAEEHDEEPSVSEVLQEEAREEGQIRLYSTRAERREAGLHRKLTPWLTFSGLLELESVGEKFRYQSGLESESEEPLTSTRETESTATVQLGFVATFKDWLEGELILEYDSGPNDVLVEEAVASADIGDFEVSIGKQYLPFGQYYSNFVTGPILEVGETLENAVTVTWDWEDRIEIKASIYEGIARSARKADNGIDWAFAVNGVPYERLGLGFSYLTDLGDADGELLEDFDNRFVRKVAGLSAYAIWIGDGFETTFEFVAAESSFRELDSDRNKPFAWNWELALFVDPRAELNFRLEGSEQLEGFPEFQWGVATTILLHPRATLTLEFLEGSYKSGLSSDDDDNPFSQVSTVGGQISIAF